MRSKTIIIAFLSLIAAAASAQITIKGKVTDKTGNPLIGATITIKGSIDGASTDTLGYFHFRTKRTGEQTLVATYIGYEAIQQPIAIAKQDITVDLRLKQTPTAIKDVVITAGSFEASDKKKGVTLNSYDIATTPTASGNIYGALTTLPGTATIREDGRLFVRGGDAYESLTYIDGLRVKKPYTSAMPDLPSRGRYSPLLFAGTTFSSGGYSAQYGQALSSALILQTTGIATKNQWGLGFLSVGVSGSETLTNGKASVSAQAEYYNLKPYMSINKPKESWNSYPQSFEATVVARQKAGANGLIKLMATFQHSQSNLEYPDFNNQAKPTDIDLSNSNFFLNLTYGGLFKNGYSLKAGVAFSADDNRLVPGNTKVHEYNTYFQSKVVLRKEFSTTVNISAGFDVSPNRFIQKYWQLDTLKSRSAFTDYNFAPFSEIEALLFDKLAFRAGVRGEYSDILKEFKAAPRLSLAWLTGENSQMSFASGIFYQTPEDQLLRFTHNLQFEKAIHYILNYQITKDNRIFRIEGYYKQYSNLVRYNGDKFYEPTLYNNNGYGYAKGFELFWRDQKSVKNLEYWVSYSYIDSKRIYRNYESKVTPPFAPKHNISLVTKYFISKLNTEVGGSVVAASGRPYNNPNSTIFMNGLTKPYLDCSMNISYLFRFVGKLSVAYLQINNLLGRENIFGYNFYKDANNSYQSLPVTQSFKREFMFGVFLNW